MEVVAEKPSTNIIPEGYKRTEIGVIPNDWEMRFIKDLAHIGTGAKNTEDKIDDGRYPFFVRSSKVERINSYSFDGEAVLTAGDGVNTGKIFHYINGKFDYHQRVYKISNFNKDIDGYYFYLAFSQYFYERVMGMTAKSSVDSVRMEMIADMKLPFPPTLKEQRAIAEALSDVDALIAELDALIEKKQQVKKGAMQQLLTGKNRLPGFDGEWEEKKLGDISTITSGDSPSKFKIEEYGVPYYKVEQLNNSDKYLSETPYHIANQISVPANSIIFPKRGASIFQNKIRLLKTDSYFDTNLMALTLIDGVNHEFIFYILSFIKLDHIADTTSIPQLNNKHIEPFKIPLPPTLEEQNAIARILSDMDAEIQALQSKRSKYEQIKQGMMQELLTGKTRLVE